MTATSPGRRGGGEENLPDVRPEDLRVRRPLDDHARGGAIQADRGNHGGDVPVAAQDVGMQALAALC
ncbi:MAG: hypothetical protein EOP85_00885 [Verrucomicrobiaceae bacterium]|nr:MAG: hypothetical protein EOP85_00885 [Verrucomicrobiaceae bacterium]